MKKSIKSLGTKVVENTNAIKGGLNFPLTSKAKSTARG